VAINAQKWLKLPLAGMFQDASKNLNLNVSAGLR
jgi:hypothetical protein